MPAMATCLITVVFSPTATGNRTGTLTIVDSAADSPHTVSLMGTGVTNLGLGVAADGSDTATVSAGASASYKLTIGGTGVGGNASLSCTGAPAEATCSVPATQNVNANTQGTFTANITTTPRTMGALHCPGAENPGWFSATAVMAGLILVSDRTEKTNWEASDLVICVTGFVATHRAELFVGGGGGHQTLHGTPAGTYNLMVTATIGSNSQSTMLTLIVQ